MRSDSSIQFNLARPDPLPQAPAWLRSILNLVGKILEPIGRLLAKLWSLLPDANYARYLLLLVIALCIIVVGIAVYHRVRRGEWRLWSKSQTRSAEYVEDHDWEPEEGGARSWLEEADALAAQGRYAEAIHHLLFRSVEDISRRRPKLVRPALTSRELAAASMIPPRARALFAGIARLVERSLFGGKVVGEGEWLEARGAYADFALASAWRA